MVLLEVRLEWRGTSSILWLVSKSSSGVEGQVIVVDSDLVLTLPHAPEDECDATKEECTADATDDTANDLLVGLAEAVSASTSLLRCWGFGDLDATSGDGDRAGAGFGHLRDLAIAQSRCSSNSKGRKRCGDEGTGPDDSTRRSHRLGRRRLRLISGAGACCGSTWIAR